MYLGHECAGLQLCGRGQLVTCPLCALQNTAGPSGKRPLESLAEATEFFSGSDLFNLCAAAATNATNKLLREQL